MPHVCVKCGKVYEDTDQAVLKGCSCGSHFFFYVRKERYEELKSKAQEIVSNLSQDEIREMEKEVKDMLKQEGHKEDVIVLDVETIRVIKPGKYEIDIMQLFRGKPIVIRIADGKYIIDLDSAFDSKSK